MSELDREPITPPTLELPSREGLESMSGEDLHRMWANNHHALLQVIEAAHETLPFFALHATHSGRISGIIECIQTGQNLRSIDTLTFYERNDSPELFLMDLYTLINYIRTFCTGANSPAPGAILVINTDNEENHNWARPNIVGEQPELKALPLLPLKELDTEPQAALCRRTRETSPQGDSTTPNTKSKITLTADDFDTHVPGTIYEADLRRELAEIPWTESGGHYRQTTKGCLGERLFIQHILNKVLEILGVYS